VTLLKWCRKWKL